MEYTKPEVTSLGDAVSLIQGMKNDPTKNDQHSSPAVGTTAAYAADE